MENTASSSETSSVNVSSAPNSVDPSYYQQTSYYPENLQKSSFLSETSGVGDRCERCNKTFNSELSLKTHLTYHSDNLITMWGAQNEARDESTVKVEVPETCSTEVPVSENETGLNSNSHFTLPPIMELDNFHSITSGGEGDLPSIRPCLPLPSAVSPMDYHSSLPAYGPPSNQNNMVAQGPSSAQSNSGASYQSPESYCPEYIQLQTVPSLPQHSPNVSSHSTHPHYILSSFGTPGQHQEMHSPGATAYDDCYRGQQLSRFHPYTRTPTVSPNVIKEEPKAPSENNDILDLDSHRFLANNSRTSVPQLSGNMQQIWRPLDQQSSASSIMGSRTAGPGTVQHISNGLYSGSTVHPQQPTPVIPHGYSSSIPSGGFHPQGYPMPTAVANSSPNYLTAETPSPNPMPALAGQSSDGPPPPSEFPTNVKRPKNYKCETCGKWFTSQGHLKRHYNTNLHRNMVKQRENKQDVTLGESTSVQTPTQTHLPSPSPVLLLHQTQTSPADSSISSPSPRNSSSQGFIPTLLENSNSMIKNEIDDMKAPSSLINSFLQSGGTSHELRPHDSQLSDPHSLQQIELDQQNNSSVVSMPDIYSSLPSYQPEYTQPQFSQVQVVQPQYADSPIFSTDTGSSSIPTSLSTMYHGHFSANPSSMQPTTLGNRNNNGASTPFFQAGPTPMNGGGYHAQNNNLVTSQSTSPQTLHSGGYLSPEVHTSNDFSGQNISNAGCSDQNDSNNYSVPSSSSNGYAGQNGASEAINSSEYSSTSLTNTTQDPFNTFDNLHIMEGTERSNGAQSSTVNLYTQSPDEVVASTSTSPDATRKPRPGTVDSNSEVSNDSVTTTVSGSDNSDEKTIKCEDCPKMFGKSCYLTQHRKTYHVGEQSYKCEKCGKKFNDENIFEEHKSKHAGDKPYKCIECPKQFNHKTDLRRHSCLHTGEKPFSCAICQKGFIRKDHMVKHMTTHKKKQAASATSSHSCASSRTMTPHTGGGLPPYPPGSIFPTNTHIGDRFTPHPPQQLLSPHMPPNHHLHLNSGAIPHHMATEHLARISAETLYHHHHHHQQQLQLEHQRQQLEQLQHQQQLPCNRTESLSMPRPPTDPHTVY